MRTFSSDSKAYSEPKRTRAVYVILKNVYIDWSYIMAYKKLSKKEVENRHTSCTSLTRDLEKKLDESRLIQTSKFKFVP